MKLTYLNIKQAVRHLLRRWSSVLLAVLGLVAAMSCLTISVNRLWQKTHYDAFRPDYRHLYVAYVLTNDSLHNFCVPKPVTRSVRSLLPDAQQAGIVTWLNSWPQLSFPDGREVDGNTGQVNVLSANIPVLMGMDLIQGDARQALTRRDQVIVNRKEALRVFGTDQALGKKIVFSFSHQGAEINQTFTVSGVVDDPLETSLLSANWYLSEDWITEKDWENWSNNNSYCVFRTSGPEESAGALTRMTQPYSEPLSFGVEPINMVPLLDRNPSLWSVLRNDVLEVLVSLLLMASALFNYVAMLVSMFQMRLREYQLRVSLGARWFNNAAWIYTEVLLVGLVTAFFSFVALEQSARWLEIDMQKQRLFDTGVWCLLAVLAAMALCTLYPLLSLRRNCIRRFSGLPVSGHSHYKLMFVQLLASSFFLAVNTTMVRQVNYMMSEECMGFNNKNILRVWTRDMDNAMVTAIMNRLSQGECGAIERYALSPSAIFGSRQTHPDSVFVDGDPTRRAYMYYVYMRPEVLELWGIEPVKGRILRPDTAGTGREVMLSRDAARLLGCETPGTPLPQHLTRQWEPATRLRVVGVCNYQATVMEKKRSRSMDDGSYPFMLECLAPGEPCFDHEILYVRTAPGRMNEARDYVLGVLTDLQVKDLDGMVEVESEYLDYSYKNDRDTLRVYLLYLLVSLLITVFGVFAMVGHTMECQRRSVAVRRVFGASAANLLRHYVTRYVLLVLFAVAVSYPLAHYFLQQVLNTYRDPVSFGLLTVLFVLAFHLLLVVCIVWLQVMRAMHDHPADVVKSD